MTVIEWSKKYLTDRGLWADEADIVIGKIKSPALIEILHKESGDYPMVFLVTVALVLDRHALDYIDTEKPMHFARPMFAHKGQ